MIGYWILKTNHLRSWPCWVKSLWMIMKNMPWFGRAALKELGKEYDYAFYVLARLDLKNGNLHGARVNLNKPFLFVPIECVTIDCWVKFMRSLNVLMKPWSIKKNVLRWTLIMSNHMPPLVIWTWLVKIMIESFLRKALSMDRGFKAALLDMVGWSKKERGCKGHWVFGHDLSDTRSTKVLFPSCRLLYPARFHQLGSLVGFVVPFEEIEIVASEMFKKMTEIEMKLENYVEALRWCIKLQRVSE